MNKKKKGSVVMKRKRRKLAEMPFDKMFYVDGHETFCHATGYEVCDGNPDNPADWWNEYVSPSGDELLYGR